MPVFAPWYGCTVPNIVSCGTDVINHQDKQITPNNPSSVSSSASDQGEFGPHQLLGLGGCSLPLFKVKNRTADNFAHVTTVVTLILLFPCTQPDGCSFPLAEFPLHIVSPQWWSVLCHPPSHLCTATALSEFPLFRLSTDLDLLLNISLKLAVHFNIDYYLFWNPKFLEEGT